MEIKFRPAKAADVKTAVPLIYSSGPANFDFVFKRKDKTAVDFLSFAFEEGGGEFGYKNHVAVELGGEVVGVGAGFGSREAAKFTIPMAMQIMKFYGLVTGLGVVKRGLQIEGVIEPPKSKEMHYIAHLGVVETYRSRGIGAQLVDYLIAEGREAGRKTATLDVSTDNPRAEALYERLGFAHTQDMLSKLSNEFGTVLDLKRMEKAI